MDTRCPGVAAMRKMQPQLDVQQKLKLIENGLTKVADRLGDITPLVMDDFYSRYPKARELFDTLSLGNPQAKEGEMVMQIIYCLMAVIERPSEIQILLFSQVPHHEFLKIPIDFFTGLIDSTVNIARGALTEDDTECIDLLSEVGNTLKTMSITIS